MNKQELYRLIGGTAVLAMLVLGSMLLINQMQASEFGELGYKFDIYADHYHGDPTWASLKSMYYSRDGHTATVMADGRIFVVGGTIGASTAEIYDPTNNSWTLTSSPTHARNNHAAVLLQDGRILVAGGGNVIAEIFNPATVSWTPTNPMSNSTGKSAAVRLQDGRVLVVSGADPEIYNPGTNSWSSAGTHVGGNRFHPVISPLQDGRVLLSGGGSNLPGDANAEVYNPGTNSWTAVADMNQGRKYHTSTLLQDGRVLVTSGDYGAPNAEIYNPATNSWSFTSEWKVDANDAATRQYHAAVLMDDGKVIVAGGGTSANAKIYDPAADQWSSVLPLATNRQYQEMVKLQDGRIVVLGGVNASFVSMNSVEVYGTQPVLVGNAPIGKPGSYFTFYAYGLPANEKINIFLNGQQIGVGITNNSGSLTFQISTVGAQLGNYLVTLVPTGQPARPLSVNAVEQMTFVYKVDDSAPNTWPKEAGIPFYNTPADIALDHENYLPVLRHDAP